MIVNCYISVQGFAYLTDTDRFEESIFSIRLNLDDFIVVWPRTTADGTMGACFYNSLVNIIG